MPGYVRERLLRHAVKDRPLVARQLFHPRKSLQVYVDAGPLGKKFYEGMQCRDQAQVVQHRRAQFARELVHDIDGFFHQPLGAGDVPVQSLRVHQRFLFQHRQPDVDPRQCLGDHIMQFPADAFPLLLLRREDLPR